MAAAAPELAALAADHYLRPRGAGHLPGAAIGRAGGVAGGALLELSLQVADGRVQAAGFEAFGCPATIACGSWLAEWLPGRALAEAARLEGLSIAAALELPAAKTGVALVAEDALKAALAAVEARQE